VNFPAALAHLAAAGITPPVLAAEGVDPADPAALRRLVDREMRAITDGDVLGDHRILGALRAARAALLTDAERAADDVLAARLRADLEDLYLPCDVDAAQAA
jgi:hypothetical protein